MKTLSRSAAPVNTEAQKYANLPTRQGGYRQWPLSQRYPTQKALTDSIRKEKGCTHNEAWQEAYRILRQQWFRSLKAWEKRAYLADVRTAGKLRSHAERKAFWAQDAEEGGRA